MREPLSWAGTVYNIECEDYAVTVCLIVVCLQVRLQHGLINYMDTNAKCLHLNILTQLYTLDIQSVMLVFWTQFCELLPLYPSLWLNSPSPSPPFLCE